MPEEVIELIGGSNEMAVPSFYSSEGTGADGFPTSIKPVNHAVWCLILERLGAEPGELLRVRVSRISK